MKIGNFCHFLPIFGTPQKGPKTPKKRRSGLGGVFSEFFNFSPSTFPKENFRGPRARPPFWGVLGSVFWPFLRKSRNFAFFWFFSKNHDFFIIFCYFYSLLVKIINFGAENWWFSLKVSKNSKKWWKNRDFSKKITKN